MKKLELRSRRLNGLFKSNKKILLAALLLGLPLALISCTNEGGESKVKREKGQIEASASEEKTLYTCGMHPHVVQDEPGECPICHMDLTPMKKAKPAKATPSDSQAENDGSGKERKIKHWVAPMDPTFISDKPGKSPMGMDLVPVYEGEEGAVAGGEAGSVVIDPVVVQNTGIRVQEAEKGDVVRRIRTLGEVEVAETELSVINLRFSGWIEKIWADETQQEVKRGEPLFQVYSPELISAQEEFLLAVETEGAESELAKTAEQRLRLFEVPQYHIDRLKKTRNSQQRLVVRAPRSGFILDKNVVLGAKVSAGTDLYRIGNLDKIWVQAELYEFDAPWVKLGQKATMTLPFLAGKSWEGKVSFINSTINKESRTLPVRLEFENPGVNLKPGMFATVYIDSEAKENVIRIPTESIIRSGKRQVVFTYEGDGHFNVNEVVTGLVGDDHMTEVIHGIEAGEKVVTSGQFLLDSESQLQEAIQKMMEERLAAK